MIVKFDERSGVYEAREYSKGQVYEGAGLTAYQAIWVCLRRIWTLGGLYKA